MLLQLNWLWIYQRLSINVFRPNGSSYIHPTHSQMCLCINDWKRVSRIQNEKKNSFDKYLMTSELIWFRTSSFVWLLSLATLKPVSCTRQVIRLCSVAVYETCICTFEQMAGVSGFSIKYYGSINILPVEMCRSLSDVNSMEIRMDFQCYCYVNAISWFLCSSNNLLSFRFVREHNCGRCAR